MGSEGNALVGVTNVTGAFTSGLADALSAFATGGATTTAFRAIITDDSDVNITINDTTGTLDAENIAVIRDSDGVANKTSGTMTITGHATAVTITGTNAELVASLITTKTKASITTDGTKVTPNEAVTVSEGNALVGVTNVT